VAKIEAIKSDALMDFVEARKAMEEGVMRQAGLPGRLLGQPTIQDAFMADIVANPEDDTPRLIYADWLQDHGGEEGEARAEFIRAQCLRERYFRPTYNEAAGSDSAAARLLRRFGHNWMGADRYEAGWGRDCAWSRGFIAEARAPLAVLLEHLPRLVQEHPITRAVATDKEPRAGFSRTNDFLWLPGIRQTNPHEIPFEVGQHLGRKATFIMGGLMVYSFPTAKAAHDALSRALLTLART